MRALLLLPLRYLATIFRERDITVLVVMAGFFVVGLLVMAATFFGLREGLMYLGGQDYFGEALILMTLESFFGVVFVISLAGSALSAASVFLASRDTPFLLSLPLSASKIFLARWPSYLLLTSWPVLILGLPGIFALASTNMHTFATLALGSTALLLFLILFSALGAAIPLVLWPLGRIIHPKILAGGVAVLIIAAGVLLGRLILPKDTSALFGAPDLSRKTANFEPIRQRFHFVPSHTATEALFFASRGNIRQSATALGELTAEVLAVLAFLTLIVTTTFKKILISFEEQGGNRQNTPQPLWGTLLPNLPGTAGTGIVAKDILSIIRNPREVSSLLFFLFLFGFYILLSWRIGKLEDITNQRLFPLLVGFNAAGIVYLAAAFALRFIFPLIGKEGQSAWILFSMPVPFRTLFRIKLFFSTLLLWLIGMPLALLSFLFLGLPPVQLLIASTESLAILLLLASLNLGIGGMSPELRRRDPERMSTTPAGLLTTGLALVTAWVFYEMARALPQGISTTNMLFLFLAWIAALGTTLFVDRIVPRAIARRDLTI